MTEVKSQVLHTDRSKVTGLTHMTEVKSQVLHTYRSKVTGLTHIQK